jgi:hypothetical protein
MPCAGVTQFIVATPKSAALEGPSTGPTSVDGSGSPQGHAQYVAAVGPTHKGRFPLRHRERFYEIGNAPNSTQLLDPSIPPRTTALSTSAHPAITITNQSAIAIRGDLGAVISVE